MRPLSQGINGLLLLEDQILALVKLQQNDLLEEKGLKNKEIKSPKTAFPAVIRDIQSCLSLLNLFSQAAGFCPCALKEDFARR